MKILLISKDKTLFTEKGPTYDDLIESAKRVEEIHVIVHTVKADGLSFKKIISDSSGKSSGNIHIFLYPTNSIHPLFFIRDTTNLARFQITYKFHLIADLISAEGGVTTAISAYLISWKYGKNFIMGVHQHFDDMTAHDNIFVRLLKKDALNFLFKKAYGIRVSSQSIGEEIYSESPELASKIYILPFVSDIEGIRQAYTNVNIHDVYKKFKIVLLHASKSISFDSLIRARGIMSELRARYPRIGLVIISKVRHSIRNWPQSIFVPKSIVFGKRIHDMTSYYRTANVFIDTSYATDTDDITKQNSELVDAALAGCPIVTSKTEASTSIIHDGENGFIVDPADSKLFARKIIDILEKVGLRELMSFARFTITEVYGKSIEGYADRLVGIWEKCKSTEEKNAHIDRPARPLTPEQAQHSPAITMLVAERLKQKMARSAPFAYTLAPREGEMGYVLDLDKIKVGIEEVVKELENQPERITVDESVIDL